MRWTEKDLAAHLERTGVRGAPNKANTSKPPFALPDEVVLDLPPPMSVNRSRRIDWRSQAKLQAWKEHADKFVLAAKSRGELKFERIPKFSIEIVLSEDHCKIDADNGLKCIIDYLRRVDIIANDAKKNMRRIVVDWGHAPAGVRVTVRPLP
jgi:Holliday junction resolvase RusA-like endonuclease